MTAPEPPNVLRPGTVGDLGAVTDELFGESQNPTLDRQTLLERILEVVRAEKIQCEELLVSDGPVRPGALFDASGASVPFPKEPQYSRCFVALVDPTPEAKWGHPAHWAFVPADGVGDIAFRPTNQPPHVVGPVRFIAEACSP